LFGERIGKSSTASGPPPLSRREKEKNKSPLLIKMGWGRFEESQIFLFI